ncbi:DNA polymerase III subunit alpha [Rapidithrix thailandica]|uniref:DNA polymerase III subunit alpha n=1 Tax=Rapidithrix thailandica TaxID=413964 RepID=A0AAW9SE06_9BACT
MYLIFDTETTGLPVNWKAPYTDLENWPRLVQLAYQLHDKNGNLLKAKNIIVKPEGFTIPFNAEKVHGISTERALKEGRPLKEVMEEFAKDVEEAKVLIGHNILGYDIPLMGAEYLRSEVDESTFMGLDTFDTMVNTVDFTALPGGRGGKYKPPKLEELHQKLFGFKFEDAHDAAYDVAANAKCYFALLTEQVAKPYDETPVEEIIYEAPKLDEANFKKKSDKQRLQEKAKQRIQQQDQVKKADLIPFTHLHVHSEFSILQSSAKVKAILKKAREMEMPAIAITDLGNLHAAFNAVAGQGDDLKVIIGCEFYVAEERTKLQFTKDNPDKRFQQLLIAKNQNGYKNISKLSSIGYIEGFYSGVPRVDKELIVKYKEDVIATTGNLNGEVPRLILNVGEHQAEEAFVWWHEQFGEDYYVELLRHGIPEEEKVNEVLLRFARKYGVKPIASNDVYYLDQKDALAHEVLLCVKEGKVMSMEKGFGRKRRMALPNDQYYFKTQEEMNQLFVDLPEALENTNEIVEKCSPLKLSRDILLPAFPMPPEFETQDDYLKHLTYEGAKKRYNPLTDEIKERIDFELGIIQQMGFPGYFLIVQDFIRAARDMGVSVGPGRGSAAGSVAAYCTGITNIDPIKYNLLFERFLNPERVSMPDIDIDFDDRGRQDVIDWVVQKYGKNQVAQIITYGTMAAKLSIKDVARAMELPLAEANALAKMVPDAPGTTLNKAFEENRDLKDIYESDPGLQGKVMKQAHVLEGSVRGTGIHAAGVIIAPDDLLEYIPVCTAKEADLLVTQFDGKVVESAGMLKMDFLGLKTLTIIKDAIALVKKNHGIEIDPDEIPLDDEKTYQLYQRGETVGTFQFESEGMRMYLKDLKPTNIEDLIAMNALYRPGPMQFIPNFINRKHGTEKVEYPHELLEPILSYSNGIMVYQEQIMQTAQILAGFSLGRADILRRAMGKKKMDVMAEMKAVFVEGAKKLHGIEKAKSEEVFGIMEKFAAYGFNRSHSAAYSVVAYQTGFLKANYPPEYMAAVMSHSMGNIDKISFFMEECKSMGLKVLGPDVNESFRTFDVNDEKNIRFGLAAVKGAGDAAVDAIIEEREKNGPYKSLWEFVERVDLRKVNKKTLESLAYAGAFDSFEYHRAQFFYKPEGEQFAGIEKLLKYGVASQAEKKSMQVTLFGGTGGMEMPKPKILDCEPWTDIVKLRYEKEVVGFYISGHPLGVYRVELENFCVPVTDIENHKNKEIAIGGIISAVNIRQTKNGSNFALFSVEDFDATANLAMFSENYLKNAHMLTPGGFVYIKGRVQERYKQPGQWELSPHTILPLENVREKFCTKIDMKVDIKNLDERAVADLHQLIENHIGKCTMHLEIYENIENIRLKMYSRRYKVDPSNDFMKEVARMDFLECKIG